MHFLSSKGMLFGLTHLPASISNLWEETLKRVKDWQNLFILKQSR